MIEFGLVLAFLVIGGLWLCIDVDDCSRQPDQRCEWLAGPFTSAGPRWPAFMLGTL